MSTTTLTVRIGICASEDLAERAGRAWGIWPVGYPAAVTAAGAAPVSLPSNSTDRWGDVLNDVHGVVLAGSDRAGAPQTAGATSLLHWCCDRGLPVLAVDQGLLTLNTTFGGGNYLDLSREVPEALQHRHPPEPGLRHAINVERKSRLAGLYGEGEIVVNSEHRRAVCRVARGFKVCARALDNVIEAIEAEDEEWFALGVQWQPASATASGLDIQLFRGLVEAAAHRTLRIVRGSSRTPTPRRAPRRRQLVSA